MNKPHSLKGQLLSLLMLPLILVVVLDASISYFVALHYADLVHDRWLLDSAKSLEQEVKTQKNQLTFELPPIAVEVFRWDDMDETFFKVESQVEGFMAGDDGLPSPPLEKMNKNEPFFSDGEIQGKKVRIVSVLMVTPISSDDVLISVAETLNKRRSMGNEIFLSDVLPQSLLIFITGFYIWIGVNRGLKPLEDLAQTIAKRSARELDPIPDSGVPLEVRSLTHTINALLQRIGLSIVTQQRFIENAAHQLRTPLAGLKVQAELALRADDLETMQPALAHIKNAADRVAHLSTQLLVLARSESMSHSLSEFKKIDLIDLVRECCMDWAPKAMQRDMALGFEASPMPCYVEGNETLLRELLNNLLDNAVRYGRSGGQISVKIEVRPQIMLAVEDDGPGISPNEIDKVFERFYRIQGSPGEGCGLGLAIVKEIADLHAARIHMSSGSSGRGIRVEIVF